MSLTNDEVKLEVHRLYDHESLSIAKIASITGIATSTLSDFVSRKTYKEFWDALDEKPVAAGTLTTPEERRVSLPGQSYVFVAAQNNSFVFMEFWESLLTYRKHNGAELKVGTFSYNKSGFQSLEKGEGEWFDPKIKPYILDQSASLRNEVIWCGELNILPTAANPLSGFDTYTRGCSGVVPHAKVSLQSCPVAKGSKPKFMYTTGAVTKSNYIQKKAGQKAEFHHSYGALVVEFDENGDWFARQLLASKDGSFYDLDKKYTPTGVEKGQRAKAINWGDLHSEKPDEEVYAGSFGDKDSLLDRLKPEYQFAHDTLDFSSRNHHNINNVHFRLRSQVYSSDKVQDDVKAAANTFKMMDRKFCKTICVESNHDLALIRWLNTADIRFDNIANALFYHKCQVKVIEAILEKRDGQFSIFEDCIREIYPSLNIEFLREDQSFIICPEHGGIECGSHGHLGVNGARGTPMAYKRLDMKYNVGHGHTAFIKEGVCAAGLTGNPDQKYNKGPTTWSSSHIVTYPNGKRAIITMRGRKHAAG